MFRFAHPEFLYALLVIPVLIGLFYYSLYQKSKRLKVIGDKKLLANLMPEASHWRPRVKFYVLLIAITLSIFMVAGPQFGSKLQKVKRSGIEMVIAVDVSNSMLAQDLTPSRMQRAKQLLSRLIDQSQNNKVALLVFAGDAYVQMPMTTDVMSAKMFLNSINPGMVPIQGTAIGSAIRMGMGLFTTDAETGKSIIIITDGENHEDDAVEAARAAAEQGVKVNVVGIGSTKGAPIPISGSSNNFMKDAEGKTVITKLNEAMAREVAKAGEGVYVRADNTNGALQALINEVRTMKSAEFERKTYSEYNEQFPGLAWIALILLLVDAFLLERKYGWISSIHIFNRKK